METSTDQQLNQNVPDDTKPPITGCAHYKRKSKFVTPCCNKVYTCRFCHDENEDHTVNRKEVTELVCTNCNIRQPVQAECQYCGIRFGKYTCLECNLFDDEDKNQYHCDGCGICRIGGGDRFFHCPKCNMCLPLQLKNGHRCVENVSRANCPVCLENIHTSRIPCHIPDCGHLLHKTCFEQLLESGHYACPTCQTSLLDMTQLWKYLDREVAMTPMPIEYRNYKVEILCKDCHKEGQVKFHVVGLKCLHCGSYNTCRIKGSGLNVPTSLTSPQTPSSNQNNGSANNDTNGDDTHRNGDGTEEESDTEENENNLTDRIHTSRVRQLFQNLLPVARGLLSSRSSDSNGGSLDVNLDDDDNDSMITHHSTESAQVDNNLDDSNVSGVSSSHVNGRNIDEYLYSLADVSSSRVVQSNIDDLEDESGDENDTGP